MASQVSFRLLLCWICFESGAASTAIRIPLRFQRASFDRRDVPMGGSDARFGEYYVDTRIGGKPFSLMLDTGSSDLAVHAAGCTTCGAKINAPYDPRRTGATPLGCEWCDAHKSHSTSTTCKDRGGRSKQCTFMMSYADKSGFSAALYNDSFAFATMSVALTSLSTDVVVGAIYTANFPNPKDIDGIIGFGGRNATSTGAPTPFDRLVSKGKIEDVFSICLFPDGNGGHLYLGTDGVSGVAGSSQPAPIAIQGAHILDTEWTPLLLDQGFYGVDLQDIRVDGVSIGVRPEVYNKGQAIVDSGTQDVSLPATAFKHIKAHFAALCSNRNVCLKGVCDCKSHRPLKSMIFENRCVEMTESERDAYPVIEIQLGGGVVVKYPPRNYLKSGTAFCEKHPHRYTIAIGPNGPDGSGTILGESFMMGYLVVHDRQNKRIGFQSVSETNCPGIEASPSVIV